MRYEDTQEFRFRRNAILYFLASCALIGLTVVTSTTENFNEMRKGLASYTWAKTSATVLQADARQHGGKNRISGSLTVRYTYHYRNVTYEDKEELFQQWNEPDRQVYDDWVQSFAVGSTITILTNGQGESSVGHWPKAYTWVWALGTVMNVTLVVQCLLGARKNLRRYSQEKRQRYEDERALALRTPLSSAR
jgi:hypothetical protein